MYFFNNYIYKFLYILVKAINVYNENNSLICYFHRAYVYFFFVASQCKASAMGENINSRGLKETKMNVLPTLSTPTATGLQHLRTEDRLLIHP